MDDGDEPTELKVSPDGKRAFVHYGLHHKVATLDLEAKTATGSAKTGRGGKKFLGNMMGGLYGWPGLWAAGYSIWIYTRPSMLAVRPDGRYAYAINNQTKDITVVDGTTGKSAEMIGGNGYSLELLKDGRSMLEVSDSELRLVDLERNVKAAEIPLPDLRGLSARPTAPSRWRSRSRSCWCSTVRPARSSRGSRTSRARTRSRSRARAEPRPAFDNGGPVVETLAHVQPPTKPRVGGRRGARALDDVRPRSGASRSARAGRLRARPRLAAASRACRRAGSKGRSPSGAGSWRAR